MVMRLLLFASGLLLAALPLQADDGQVRLAAPSALVETGLLKYILPRFSLKTQVRVTIVAPDEEADLSLGTTGAPLFTGPAATWHLALSAPEHADARKLADWLTSEIGRRTITSFAPEGTQVFTLAALENKETDTPDLTGSAENGRAQSRRHCGRCHVVIEDERMNAIGSTPSFFVLRTLRDWQARFEAFYALNPHPAFTQLTGVTPPFPEDRPSPIVPVELSPDDLDDILAYVAALKPADLGAPLQHQ